MHCTVSVNFLGLNTYVHGCTARTFRALHVKLCILRVNLVFISMAGLSHSRYLRKVHQKLSHLVSPTPLLLGDNVVNRKTPLSEKEWLDFCKLAPSDVSSKPSRNVTMNL